MSGSRRSRRASLMTAMFMAVLLTPALGQSARADSSPDGTTVWQGSIATMRSSLQTVHGVSTTRATEGEQHMTLHAVGDCRMRPTSLRSRFHMWGTRFTQGDAGGVVPERYDRQFVVIEKGQRFRVWERNALTDKRWRRNDSNNDALEVFALCPASTGAVTSIEQLNLPPFTDLGARTVAGSLTWHLRSEGTSSDQSTRTVVDLDVDQTTQFLVRTRTEVISTGEQPSDYISASSFSRFNAPLTIKPPQ